MQESETKPLSTSLVKKVPHMVGEHTYEAYETQSPAQNRIQTFSTYKQSQSRSILVQLLIQLQENSTLWPL